MLNVKELSKNYGDFVAVDRISFSAAKGKVFGLLGPNGAGKSTTINCIAGLLKPTSGHAEVAGHDVVSDGKAARRELGVVPQELALYEDLPAIENLRFWGKAYGLGGHALDNRVTEVLEYIGLNDRAKDLPKEFSGGMKRRLNFGCGIVHKPPVILLDEPTVGVDPQSRARLFDMVEAERDAGACVLYTTHYMEEAERLCDSLAIIDHGKLIAQGSVEELRAKLGARDVLQLVGHFPVEGRRQYYADPVAGIESSAGNFRGGNRHWRQCLRNQPAKPEPRDLVPAPDGQGTARVDHGFRADLVQEGHRALAPGLSGNTDLDSDSAHDRRPGHDANGQ
jgi:ABC-2 type transport system ATP-binding protein